MTTETRISGEPWRGGPCPICLGPHLSADVHSFEELRALETTIEEHKRTRERVDACSGHDTDGPADELSGFPTCSKCGAILTDPVPVEPPGEPR